MFRPQTNKMQNQDRNLEIQQSFRRKRLKKIPQTFENTHVKLLNLTLTQTENITADTSVDILNTSNIESVIQATKQTTENKLKPKSIQRDIVQDISELIAERNKLLKIKNKPTSVKVELNLISKLIE